ncbi:hypothetical protein KVR01_001892 [Diaporthe batatas]|uniref:uncharacterized protein n=1 Tax=Diaporthe batatas TaxID=748121 RepID=UPI001D05405B|nr:uncharacterized protein KVR01_001892 [Diaporthe batatas]KAG8169143.1 hypothetical protein KVR01_001892 [Diaporthe batatas]
MASQPVAIATVEEGLPDQPGSEADQPSEPYTVLTKLEQCCILAMISYASWSANLSTFIFLPALKPLSEAFEVSVDKINLIITVYMAVGAVVPLFVGDAADILGRRAAYVMTLSVLAIANLCLALADSYEYFLGLRMLQAVGQSGKRTRLDSSQVPAVLTLTNRKPQSITIGPSLGPVLGGALTYAAGWTWIFWLLTIVTFSGLSLIVLFLPETNRGIVGNGSIPPAKILRLPLPFTAFMQHHKVDTKPRVGSSRIPNPVRCVKVLFRKDNAVVVVAWGLILTASLSTLFIEIYGLTKWQVGLIYLPFALGGTASTLFSGKLLDGSYKNARTKLGLPTDRIKGDDLDNFPIEKSRLNVMWIPMALVFLCTAAYGWVLQYKQHIAISMVLQFVTGMALQINFSVRPTPPQILLN